MDIILLKDVENLGYANTVVTVKPGYARNFLIPQGMAIVANKQNKEALNDQINAQQERIRKMIAEAQLIADKLEATPLRIASKAGTSGKIFGSVNYVQIASALKEQFGLDIEKKKIKMPEEIKMLGKYTCEITLMKEVRAKVIFEVYNDDPNAPVPEETVDNTGAVVSTEGNTDAAE
jgi:large subunit ribosomal protein L9